MGTVFIILKLTSLCGSRHPHHLAQLHLLVSNFLVLLLIEQQSSFLNKKIRLTCDKDMKENATKNKSSSNVMVVKTWRLQHSGSVGCMKQETNKFLTGNTLKSSLGRQNHGR